MWPLRRCCCWWWVELRLKNLLGTMLYLLKRLFKILLIWSVVDLFGFCHTKHKDIQWSSIADWVRPQESIYLCIDSTVISDWLLSNIKAAQRSPKIFKITKYILNKTRVKESNICFHISRFNFLFFPVHLMKRNRENLINELIFFHISVSSQGIFIEKHKYVMRFIRTEWSGITHIWLLPVYLGI